MNNIPRSYNILATMLFSAFILTGCGEGSNTNHPTKTEIKYLSHIDQAQFYQQQGQLKESILEARRALELQQGTIDPFLIIGENLLIAGDGRSAEKQFRAILNTDLPEIKIDAATKEKAEILLAKAMFSQRKPDEALVLLNESKITEPDLIKRKKILLGDIYLAKNEFTKAANYYNEVLTADKNSINALIGLSKSELAQGNSNKADEHIITAEKITPNNPQLWLWKAQLAQHKKQWAASEEAYIRALEDIGSFDIMTFEKYKTISDLIVVLREQGKSAEAFVYEEILAKSAPGATKSTYMSAVKNYKNGNLIKAEAELSSILAQSPNHKESAILLGIIKYNLGKFEEAEKLLASNIEAGGPIEISKVLAATKLKLRQPKEAKEILSTIEQSNDDPQLLALIGMASLTSGDTKTGLDYINKSLTLNPDNSKLRLTLANFLINSGRTEEAISELTKISDSSPDIHEANLRLVAVYTQNDDIASATKLITNWKSKFPKSAKPYIAEAGAETFKQQLPDAEKLLMKAITIDSNSIAAHIALSDTQVKLNKKQAAINTLEAAIQIQPDNRISLTRYLAISSQPEDKRNALIFLTKMREIHKEEKTIKLGIADLLAQQGKVKEALDIVNNLSSDDNNDIKPTKAVAAIYKVGIKYAIKNNDGNTALALAQEAREALPENMTIGLMLASIQLEQDKVDEGLTTLQELKIAHSDSERPYELEGDYYSQRKDYSRASEAYALAKSKQSSDKLNVKIYNSLKASNDTISAIKHLNDWATEAPNNTGPLTLLAMHYQNENNKEKAISLYEQVVSINENDIVSLNNLAWLYYETKNKAAESTAEKAFNLNPNSAAIADTYGWILLHNNKLKLSTQILQKAHTLDPNSKEIGLHLAKAYESLGKKEEANKVKGLYN